MTVYVVAQLQVTNEGLYRRYQAAFPAVWAKFQGRVLAADESPQVMEGQWIGNKVVLLSFPHEAAYREWAESGDYQAIAQDRFAGARTVTLLVHGLEPTTFPAGSATTHAAKD